MFVDERDEKTTTSGRTDKTTNTNTLPKCSSLPRLLVRLSACLLAHPNPPKLPNLPNLPKLPKLFFASFGTTSPTLCYLCKLKVIKTKIYAYTEAITRE